ncbi:DUF732 domain-containing protein [Mycobacterium sp. 1164985.4]|uniref:DUF732 domain-containing protein n=1 Tax=Mycobacterium sp. 1164985.4 TaxID=1834069 RepID=UPI000800BF60|nr:DUF732 domain-containing protein [Mycobacterium sp. 1164985.4]OBK78850.1 hypothetical protein A5650_09685 [Mycobacterium sp. 1164985.4]
MFASHRLATIGTALMMAVLGLGAVAGAGTAHDVCTRLDDGTDPVDLGMEILETTDLTTGQVATFVIASVDHYCPGNAVLFG